MSDQQPAPGVSAGYRRWAGVLVRTASVIALLMGVAFVVSLVLLALADAEEGHAAYGYLAVLLWFGIAAAVPVLLAVAIPGAVMTRRVRRAGTTPAP